MSTIQPSQPGSTQPGALQTETGRTQQTGNGHESFSGVLRDSLSANAMNATGTSSMRPFQQVTGVMTPMQSAPEWMRSTWRPSPRTPEAQAALDELARTGVLPAPQPAGEMSTAAAIRAARQAKVAGIEAASIEVASNVTPSAGALPLSAFPRPQGDTGRGIHWIPTVSQSPEVIDKYVAEAEKMGIKWVTFLNEGTDMAQNDYLVEKLVEKGIEPVMRLYTDGGAPVDGDVQAAVAHYKAKGVNYYQLYNEPNLSLENQGNPPSPERYARLYIDAARDVIAAGGYPGFGSLSPTPGLAPGSMPGDMDDLKFLREALQQVKAMGGEDVLDRSWLSVHNYGQEHLRIREYDRIVQEELGRSMPQIGTEAGIYPGDTLSQQGATEIVADAYSYLDQREEYYFAYTYWIIANESGIGHHDPAWNHQALFKQDGQSPIVSMLQQSAA